MELGPQTAAREALEEVCVCVSHVRGGVECVMCKMGAGGGVYVCKGRGGECDVQDGKKVQERCVCACEGWGGRV